MNENKQSGVMLFNKELSQKLNETVNTVVENKALKLFEKAFMMANATEQIKGMLTPEYMRPMMSLQGTKLGFKTDKDNQGGYPIEVVKNCLIEAVLTGVQVAGNHFNIIAGNCYITKEGMGYLLENTPGLKYTIVPGLPKINQDKTGAAITMKITWALFGGEKNTQELEIPIRMNNGMGLDAIIGKATRKARAWLFNNLNGTEIGDGDVEDQGYVKTETIEVTAEEVGDKLPAALVEVFACKTVEEVNAMIDKYSDLINVPDFKKAIWDQKSKLKANDANYDNGKLPL